MSHALHAQSYMVRSGDSATQITVDGKELPRATQPFYFAVNKPKGYLCANVPNKEGTTKLVVDLFEVQLKLALPPAASCASQYL